MNQTTDQSELPVALITGAGQRVGNTIARHLAAAGYRVALHVNRSTREAQATADELRAAGHEAIVVSADLRDEAATRAMVEQAHAHFGRLDALVNNAAIWHSKPLEQVRAADVREHFETNALATFVCAQAAGLIMVGQAQGGAIVNLGDWAFVRPYLNYAGYFPAKGAIPTLTRDLALELGTRNPNVRVNAVLPGPVLVPADTSEAEKRKILEATLVKRLGTPDDVARAVHFLLVNTFITGVCLPVDGGRTIYCPSSAE